MQKIMEGAQLGHEPKDLLDDKQGGALGLRGCQDREDLRRWESSEPTSDSQPLGALHRDSPSLRRGSWTMYDYDE